MYRRALGLVLALACAPAAAEWTAVGRANEIYSAFADRESIRRTGDLVHMHGLYDFRRRDTTPEGRGLFSTAVLREYGPERILVNSAADWGRSDPLLTLATGQAMLAAGFTDDDVDRVLWRNPVEFYAQSGRLDLSATDGQPDAFAGNSIARGGN